MHVCDQSLSRVQFYATPWTVAYQALLSMGFSREEYWSGLPFPTAGDLPEPGIEPESLALAGGFLTTEPPENSVKYFICNSIQKHFHKKPQIISSLDVSVYSSLNMGHLMIVYSVNRV